MVDKYSWVDIGSSYLPSDIQAAYLWGQLEKVDEINNNRLASWLYYYEQLQSLQTAGKIQLPIVPDDCLHNAHMFYIKVQDIEVRTQLIDYLKNNDIMAVFHYIPLHSSVAGKNLGTFYGEDEFTTAESERLIRLPMWCGLSEKQLNNIVSSLFEFYK